MAKAVRANAILLGVLFLLAAGSAFFVLHQPTGAARGQLLWEIKVDGKLYAEGVLSGADGYREVEVPARRGGTVKVVVCGGSVSIPPLPKDICPLGICSSMGPISKPGQCMICLPNRIIVRIKESGGS